MNSRDYFVLGSKLLGVYCLFLSIGHLAAAIMTLPDYLGLSGEYSRIMFLYRVVITVIPVLYLFFGFYLVKNGSAIHNLAYASPEPENVQMDVRDKFALFLKLLGMYLIVSYFPDMLKSISSYLTYTNAPEVYNLFQQKQFAYVTFAPSVAGVFLGFYLLRSGEVFVRIAFKSMDALKEAQD